MTWHYERNSYQSDQRALVFMTYLNDVEKGGETKFEHRSIKPGQGRCLALPPMWMFPHAGAAPITEDKYIIGTYLHYV